MLTIDTLTHAGAVSGVLFLIVFSGRFIKYLSEAAIGDISAELLIPIMLFKMPGFLPRGNHGPPSNLTPMREAV